MSNPLIDETQALLERAEQIKNRGDKLRQAAEGALTEETINELNKEVQIFVKECADLVNELNTTTDQLTEKVFDALSTDIKH